MKDIRSELKVLIGPDEIKRRISELAKRISDDYKDKPVTLVPVLRGSIFFAVDLAKELDLIFDMEFVEISSYGNEKESSGNVVVKKDLLEPVNNKNLIVIEDIIDTGRSAKFLVEHLKKFNPISIKTCILLDKKSRRVEDISPDYTGFVIPDKFIVGYGLDYNNHFRNINYVGYLDN